MPKRPISQRNLLIGDVLEIKTSRGYAYVQCANKLPFFGNLIRVLPGFYHRSITDLEEIVSKKESYFTFFYWDKYVDRDIVYKVGRLQIPKDCVIPTLFRGGSKDPKNQNIATWWLWDSVTNKEWKVGKISKKQRELPIRHILNYIALIYDLERGWHPRDEH
ncbi:MAG: hypothetical protein SFX18_10370 [Pirellulales bacterium]|nr:hypothetical protein [Pirellulales bacterium]